MSSVSSEQRISAELADMYRIARDSAARALEYLKRVDNRVGAIIESGWFTIPESTLDDYKSRTIGLSDIISGVGDLEVFLNGKFMKYLGESTGNIPITSSKDSRLTSKTDQLSLDNPTNSRIKQPQPKPKTLTLMSRPKSDGNQ